MPPPPPTGRDELLDRAEELGILDEMEAVLDAADDAGGGYGLGLLD